jgi:uncharacterized protein YxjI
MKTIKLYEDFQELPEIPEKFKDKVDLNKMISNGDGTFTYNGNLYFSRMELTELPDLKITKVHGNFWCSYNKLTSLLHAPQEVHGDFWCYNNKLTSLEHAPQEVHGDFWCSNNKLTSLLHAPKIVQKNFHCLGNKLTSLLHAPQEVHRDFWCYNNYLLSVYTDSKISGEFIFENSKVWKGPRQPLQEPHEEAIESIKNMNEEERTEQLDFFGLTDSRAYRIMAEILDDLGVDYGEKRKEYVDKARDLEDTGIF